MNVLVTGGTGQIGSAIARALARRGDAVRVLSREAPVPGLFDGRMVEHVAGDVTSMLATAHAVRGVDAVMHVAGLVSYAPWRRDELWRVNFEGTKNVLDAAAGAGVRRVVVTSTIAAIGSVQGDGEGDEDTPFDWQGMGIHYAESKKAADDLARAETRVETVVVRPGIVFGAGERAANAARIALDIANRATPASPPGSTTAANLADVAAGHLAALDRGSSGRAYVLGGWTGTFTELYAMIASAMETEPPRWVAPRVVFLGVAHWRLLGLGPGSPEPSLTPAVARMVSRNRKYRSDRAIAELGYAPQPLGAGIADMIRDLRARGLLPDRVSRAAPGGTDVAGQAR